LLSAPLHSLKQEDSTELGVSTGWRALDDLYKVIPGELTIVTGESRGGEGRGGRVNPQGVRITPE
jgi:hypothetical protein